MNPEHQFRQLRDDTRWVGLPATSRHVTSTGRSARRAHTVRVAVAVAIALGLVVPASVYALSLARSTGPAGGASQPVLQPSSTGTQQAPPASPRGSELPTTDPVSSPADPGRPPGRCADSTLSVTVAGDPGAAGTLHARIVFTNTGTRACVLRGAPGVSVVGDGNRTRLGVPAARDQSNATDVELAAHGGQAHANLTIADLFHGMYAPSGCDVVTGDGWRIYPPHSTRAYFVRENEIYACSGTPVFLHVTVAQSGAE